MKIAFYHANCCDGLFGAYAVWKKYQGRVLLVPIDHNNTNKQSPEEFIDYYLIKHFPQNKRFSGFAYELIELSQKVKEVDVFFVDFAPDIEKFNFLSKMFQTVTVLDHHKSSLDIYTAKYQDKMVVKGSLTTFNFGKDKVIFSNETCGSMLAEMYFFGQAQYYNELVNDYDLWIKAMPESDNFVAGIMAMNFKNIAQLKSALAKGIHLIIEAGELLNKVRMRRTESCCTRRVEVTLTHGEKSYKAALVNSELDISSMLGNSIVKDHGYDVAVIYSIRNPNEVGCSVRSSENVDSRFLSESFGGGGHNCASGFGMRLDTLLTVLRTGQWNIGVASD